MTSSAPLLLLVVVTAVHAGFQGTVSTVVYPALARLEPEEWLPKQDAHRYAIVPMVGICYLGALAALGWSFLKHSDSSGVWIAVVGFAISMGTTAFVAAPTHGKLMARHDRALVGRLIWSDWVRTLGAMVALGGAAWAAAGG